MIPLWGDHQSVGEIMKKEPKNLGLKRVGKIGIVIGKDPNKTILTHPILHNLICEKIDLYQDETGFYIVLGEEKTYLHE